VINQRQSVALIIGLALLSGWNSFDGSFQFDDFNVIVDNPAVASLAAWWRSMPGIRPLLKLSYALNLAWAGNANDHGRFGFHAVNLALHIGNALLLRAIILKLLLEREDAGRVALLSALLFVVHPVQTEAVTLISGRSMSLMTLFYLTSLLAYLDRRSGLSLVAFAAALATRETAMTLPLALLLIERQRSPTLPLRDLLGRTGGHWLVAGLAAAILLLLPSFRYLAEVSLQTRPLLDNIITQSAALLYLLKQTLWPTTLDADPILPLFTHWNVFWALTVSLGIGLLGGALIAWRKTGLTRWGGFGLLWFLLHLAPTNSLLPRLDIASERHLYLANAGLFLFAAAWLSQSWDKRPRFMAAMAAVLLLGLTLATQARNQVYRNEVVFWADVTAKNPANSRAFTNLGYALAGAGEAEAALAAYDQSIRLSPTDFKARLNRRALCRTLSAMRRSAFAESCKVPTVSAPAGDSPHQ